MGWKIVRDRDDGVARQSGVSGQWRESADPVAGLTRKLFEEAGEFAEGGDVRELYDVLDVLAELLQRLDPHKEHWPAHMEKLRLRGGFERGLEWNPVPEGKQEG